MDIRTRSGKLLGTIREVGGGVKEARTASGKLLGKYDPRSNSTRDPSGSNLGQGDQLSSLIWDESGKSR